MAEDFMGFTGGYFTRKWVELWAPTDNCFLDVFWAHLVVVCSPKANIGSENRPSQKENSLPITIFQALR